VNYESLKYDEFEIVVFNFYRAALCVSGVFGTLLSPGIRPSVCLSIRPSVTLVYCI